MARRRLDQARVIITGASSGIGRALAERLAALHCKLIVNARRAERLTQLAAEVQELGGQAVTVAGDVTDPDTQQQIIQASVSHYDGIDVLINNAGIGAIGPFAEASGERLRRVMEVNFFAATELTRAAIPVIANGRDPLIVNIGSVLGHRAVPLKSEYCASKFALHGWSDALRTELTESGIDVLLVSPSTTDSEFFDRVIENTTDKNWKLSGASSPDFVARRTVQAMQRRKHEIILSWSGWGLVWLDRLFPSLANRIVARFGK